MALDPEMVVKLQHQLNKFKADHHDLNEEIEKISQSVGMDDLRIHRLKKRKLHLKDLIAQIEALLVPNIIA